MDWPNVAVRFKMLIKRRVGLTLGIGRSLMHGVAPQMCGRVASPLLGRGAGGRSPGYLMPPRVAAREQMLLAQKPLRRPESWAGHLARKSSSGSQLSIKLDRHKRLNAIFDATSDIG